VGLEVGAGSTHNLSFGKVIRKMDLKIDFKVMQEVNGSSHIEVGRSLSVKGCARMVDMLKKVPKDHQKWDKETAAEASRWALKAGKGQVIPWAAALAGDVLLNRHLHGGPNDGR